MPKFCLIILFLFFQLNVSLAQSPGYLNFTTEDGLPSNSGNCITEDRQGYIWIGTEKGLSRFDGERFKNFNIEDGLPDPEIFKIFEDSYGRLWVNSFLQKPTYLYQGKFYTKEMETLMGNFKPSLANVDFIDRPDTLVWIASGNTIAIKGLDEPKIVYQNSAQESFAFLKKFQDSHLGLSFEKLYLIDITGEQLEKKLILEVPSKSFLHNLSVSEHFVMLAFLDRTELYKFEGNQLKFWDKIQEPNEFIFSEQNGIMWTSVPGKGALRYNLSKDGLSNPQKFLASKKVTSIFKDSRDIYWFSTLNEGVYCLPKDHTWNWTDQHGLPANNTLCLAEQRGQLLIGDDIGNISRFQPGDPPNVLALGAIDGINRIRQILTTSSDEMYVVSDEGCYLILGDNVKRINTDPSKSIVQATNSIWLGTSSGLYEYSIGKIKGKLIRPGRVTDLDYDENEDILWLGNTSGLFSSADSFQTNWGDKFSLLNKRVVEIKVGSHGYLWIVTSDGVLIKAICHKGEIKEVENFSDKVGLPINKVKKITLDQTGNLWLATSGGIYFIDDKEDPFEFKSEDGLLSNEINDLHISNDSVWAATSEGITLVQRKKFRPLSEAVTTHLVSIKYQREGAWHKKDFVGTKNDFKNIELKPQSESIIAEFSTPECFPCQSHKYVHQITPIPLPFAYAAFRNIFYSIRNKTERVETNSPEFNLGAKLKPGKYRIISYSLNNNNMVFSNEVEWTLTILPRWYFTIWPVILFLSLLILVLKRVYQLRLSNLQFENESMRARLGALKTQINPHFIGNSINAVQTFFFPPQPEKASEYIHLFSRLIRKTMIMSEKEFIPLSEELNYITEYLQMVELRYNPHFTYIIKTQIPGARDPVFPTMLLQPILENSTIHGLSPSGTSILEVEFCMHGAQLVSTITDNGIGIEQSLKNKNKSNKRQSKGIELLKNKIKLLNKLYQLDIEILWKDQAKSSKKGTMIILKYTPSKLKKQANT